MADHDLESSLAWMRAGTALLLERVAVSTDEELRGPSRLPGWSRAHVVGHLARNAEALTRLARWAATGIETPMYANLGQRGADIATSASLPAAQLRAELTSSAEVLDEALGALGPEHWQFRVRSALGREIPASEVPWMRVREVWLHALDLDAGVAVGEFPPALVDALLTNITAAIAGKPDCPAVRLRAGDWERVWLLTTQDNALEVTGTAADLLAWVPGRSDGTALHSPDPLPTLPAWL